MNRRIAKLAFSRGTLYTHGGIEIDLFNKMLLFLPQGSKIVGLGHDTSVDVDYIFIESDNFKETPVNQPVPVITASFTRDAFGIVHCVGVDLKEALTSSTPPCPIVFGGGGGTVTLPPGASINLGALNTCKHVWKVHHGLFEYYEYCDTCGEKKV